MAWRGDTNRTIGGCLVLTVVLATLLIIGGTELNPGPVVEVENTVQLLCTACSRDLNSGI